MGNTESSTIVKSWKQIGQDINGEAANDNSGFSVSLSSDGKTVDIGDSRNTISGHVRVYQYDLDGKKI